MAEGEKIDVLKAVKSPFTGLYWIKTIMYGLGICALLSIGYAVYKQFFAKKDATQNIHVEQGGQVIIRNEARKKSIIPWVEAYMDQRNTEKLGTGIRAGVRYEW